MAGLHLKDFIKTTKNKHYASDKVELYQQDVFELRAKDYSYEKIDKWLKTKDVNVSTKTVERYMNKNKDKYKVFLERE